MAIDYQMTKASLVVPTKVIKICLCGDRLRIVINQPVPIILGIIGFGIIRAYLYRWLCPSWPTGVAKRAFRFSLLVFVMTFLFWEFFTPYNQFGEPLALIGVELAFWVLIALADGFAISATVEHGASSQK